MAEQRPRAALVVAVTFVLASVLAACGGSGPSNGSAAGNSKIPVANANACEHGPSRAGGVQNVSLTISHVATGQLPTVGVCIGTNGPYPFVVDTGSSRSIIDSSLATNLNLKSAGTADVGGSGCATTGGLVKVPAFRMGSVPLAAQTMLSSSLSDWGGTSVDGVLGSDVFGRFGAVKLDFTAHSLTVNGLEAPAPTSNQLIRGQSGSLPPTTLFSGTPTADVPLTVVQGPGTYAPFANVTVGSAGPYPFLIDTGAPMSTMDKTAAYTAHVPNKGTTTAPAGIGCSGSVTLLKAAALSAGSTSASLQMASMHIVGAQRLGVVGYLGLDYLATSGIIVVDYASANIAFASG